MNEYLTYKFAFLGLYCLMLFATGYLSCWLIEIKFIKSKVSEMNEKELIEMYNDVNQRMKPRFIETDGGVL